MTDPDVSLTRAAAGAAAEHSLARRSRYLLYVMGGAFVALGYSLEMVPSLAALSPPLGGRVCAGFGALILSVGRFGPDGLVRRLGGAGPYRYDGGSRGGR